MILRGDWKENDKINICVEGGLFIETGTNCIEKQSVSFVRIQWSEGKRKGKIKVSSQAGNNSLDVDIAVPFNPGFIGTTDKQTISFERTAPSLSCTEAIGGSCSPSYSYQWERSSDKLRWTAINGATGRNLSFANPLKQTTYFRRKVVENKSQTTGYSNEITVFVTPENRKK